MDTKNERNPNLLVVDTNVLISDPDAIKNLMSGGNTVYLPYVVLDELENLKNSPDVGYVARKNLNTIEELQRKKVKNFVITQEESFSGLKKLDRTKNDHRIIATFNSLIRHRLQAGKEEVKRKTNDDEFQFEKFKLITNDTSMIIICRDFLKVYGDYVLVETYKRNRVKPKLEPIPSVSLKNEGPSGMGPTTVFSLPSELKKIKENDGVIVRKEGKEHLAMRKADNLKVLDPEIKLVGGIKARPLNGNGSNWPQVLAMHQMLDRDISCIFLEGGAGTGKTLLALAAGIAQAKRYDNIVVMRPMEHLGGKDNVGFLKGSLMQKIDPWLKPIEYNLKFIYEQMKSNDEHFRPRQKRKKSKNSEEENGDSLPTFFEYFNVQVETLDYIRGLTMPKIFAIIDESQNLSAMKIKTIISRAGDGSKFVFTGDLSQIDVKYLTQETSGLAHAISKLHDKMPGSGSPMVATTIFTDSIRSPLAKLAVDRLGH